MLGLVRWHEAPVKSALRKRVGVRAFAARNSRTSTVRAADFVRFSQVLTAEQRGTPFGLAETEYTPARSLLEAGGILALIRFNPDGFFDEISVQRIVIRQGNEGAIEIVPSANRLSYEMHPVHDLTSP